MFIWFGNSGANFIMGLYSICEYVFLVLIIEKVLGYACFLSIILRFCA